MKKKIVIIGAGIAGMSAGIYGQMNGFDTEIYEMHSIPGGECTGWDRGEYHFDGCIHWLAGTSPQSPFHKVWHEVGALDDSTGIINHDYFSRCEENGAAVNIYRDVNRLEQHLLDISPEDGHEIRKMCKAIKAFKRMAMPIDKAVDMFSLLDMTKMFFKMVPLMPYIQKYSAMTIKEFAEQLKHPLLQQALQSVVPNKYSSIAVFFTLSSLDSGDSGWPAGGSRRLCGRMEQKYLSLGGKIHYRSKIEKIRIEEGKATGVILTDGGERSGDYIISAADGYFTLQNMLEGKYLDGKLKKLYSDGEAYPIYTTVQVSLGIACDLSKEPHMLFFKPSHEINAGGITHERIGLKHFCYDGSIAPQGKSIITVLMDADYDWWQEGYKNKETYKAEKERIAKEVCNAIEERYPATKGKIESVDVATPMTYVRYCNAWRGAWMSWMTTLKGRIRYLPGNLKRLDNFYMTGQWTMPPGGLPGAVITGKWTIQRICKLLKYKFKTAV